MHAVPQERGYVGFKLTTSTSLNLGDLDLEVSGSGPGHVRNVVPGSSTLGITAPNAFIPTGTTSFLTFYVGSSFPPVFLLLPFLTCSLLGLPHLSQLQPSAPCPAPLCVVD